jgi:glutathione S-transferase kappa 1
VPRDTDERQGRGKSVDPMFSRDDVERIMRGAASQEMKDALRQMTQEATDRGAFGAPWMWVRNSEGSEEPFFGSDR